METTTQKTLTTLSTVELAAMIAHSSISSVEVDEAHIEQIERVNPALNTVVVKRYEAARAEAKLADEQRARGVLSGPLHGVPITIKECLDLENTPTTYGIPSRAHARATQDDVYVARTRKAGAIILGKTNVAQLLLFIESDNPVYGRTNNPWNIDRSPGGSSGGQAAIIAAGGSPLGLDGSSRDLGVAGGYTALYNLLGYPTGIVPLTSVRSDEEVGRKPSRDMVEQAALKVERGSAGLPVGVQVVARPWREHVALAAMQAIEEVASKREDYPGIALVPGNRR